MDKNIEMSLLMDFYSELLTERQQDIMELYYNDNLSLNEIAEELDISKQGVQDNIKRAEKTLYKLEKKLALVERLALQNEKTKNVLKVLELLKEIKAEKHDSRLDKIELILEDMLSD